MRIKAALLGLTLASGVAGEWALFGGEDVSGLPGYVRDAYSEYRIQRALAADSEVQALAPLRVIAFGNTFLILGDVPTSALRNRVDAGTSPRIRKVFPNAITRNGASACTSESAASARWIRYSE